MHNEFILENSDIKKENSNEKTTAKILRLGNDSLFFFGVFLAAIAVLHFIPYISGISQDFTVGIKEVAVSIIGFTNVFFFKVFNKIFKKVG